MEDQEKTYLWIVVITSLFLVAGIVLAVVEKNDISGYEAKIIQY